MKEDKSLLMSGFLEFQVVNNIRSYLCINISLKKFFT